MRSQLTRFLFTVAATTLLSLSATAGASTLTLLGSSANYPTYPATDAIDTGANHLVTDFAGFNTGNATHLDFAISGKTNHINVYDRTTSGGGNGGFVGGTTDFTTSFSLIFSNNANFTSPVATFTFNKLAPGSPTSPADFLYSSNFALTNAAYVRYQVLAANGGNPGVADIQFTGTPEPGSLALLGTGVLGMAGMARRRIFGK